MWICIFIEHDSSENPIVYVLSTKLMALLGSKGWIGLKALAAAVVSPLGPRLEASEFHAVKAKFGI